MHHYRPGFLAAALVFFLALMHCAPTSKTGVVPAGPPLAPISENAIGLTPARQYAGEVLAYMMLTVLGDAGVPAQRKPWQSRGLDAALDMNVIESIMKKVVQNKSALFVMDANILGLTEVLYHYDRNLNLFKGNRVSDSIYPSVELIALRLMLLQKRSRGEKVRIEGLIRSEAMLLDPSAGWTEADLGATGLNAAEMQLLKKIFESDAMLFRYLKHPFLLAALDKAGLIEHDDFVRQATGRANYRNYRCREPERFNRPPAVRIAFLPSLIANFAAAAGDRYGFEPDAEYRATVDAMKKNILAATERRLKALVQTAGDEWPGIWTAVARENIGFCHPDQRPFVIVPENADQAVRDICPEADFAVIILGKNVYRSIHFDETRVVYPAVNRLYLDFLDVKYAQISAEIDLIARFIVSKLRGHLPRRVSHCRKPLKRHRSPTTGNGC